MRKKMLLKRRLFLCTACVDFVEKRWIVASTVRLPGKITSIENESTSENAEVDSNSNIQPNSTSTQTNVFNTDVLVDKILEAIKKNELNDTQLSKLAKSLGQSQNFKIFADGLSFSQDYHTSILKKTFRPNRWLDGRNKVLLSFLTGINEDNSSTKKQTALIKTVEHVYHLRNLNVISPFSFGVNLLTYLVTGSKTAVTLNGASSPSGGYTSLLSSLNTISESKLSCPDGDIDTFFDNCQVVGKNHHVRLQATTPVSVITSVIHIQHPSSNAQQKIDISPEYWKWTNPLSVQHQHTFEERFIDFFRTLRAAFIEQLLEEVSKEQQDVGDGSFQDSVDIDVEPSLTKDAQVKTYVAVLENEGMMMVDKNELDRSSAESEFATLPLICDGHPDVKPNVKIGEPLLQNPNSYERVYKVLDHICEASDYPNKRKWLSVGCDGLPYLLAARIIDNTFVCNVCDTCIKTGPQEFTNHMISHGIIQRPIDAFRKYKHVLLRPGLGHFEINMVKALFKLLWSVILSFVSKLLGFRSLNAQKYCQAASDHHKSWEILQIVYQALSKELVVCFVRQMLRQHEKPTSNKFFQWLRTVRDPNFMFMQEVTFTYLLALNVFRAGVRRNNSTAVLAGRQKFCPLFYILGMTKYQEITHRDIADRSNYPPDMETYVTQTESVSVSGNHEKGEGGDFVLENKNKRIKMWLPKGVPSEKQWVRVNRNLDNLDEAKKILQTQLGFSDPVQSNREADIENEVKRVRQELRKKKYLSTPEERKIHISVEGNRLDHALVNFSNLARENKIKYDSGFEKDHVYGSVKLQRVYITEEERQKHNQIENKCKSEIGEIILENLLPTLSTVDDERAETYLEYFHTVIKKSKKQVWVDFYYEVLSSTDEAVAQQFSNRNDDNED